MNTLPTDIYINIFKYLMRDFKKISMFDELPNEIYVNIFKHLKFDFIKIKSLSKKFNNVYKLIKNNVKHDRYLYYGPDGICIIPFAMFPKSYIPSRSINFK